MNFNLFFKQQRSLLIKEIIIVLLLCIMIMPSFFKNIRSGEFISDESSWINYSKYFKLFFLQKDFRSEKWKDPEAYDHLPVAKYIIGFVLYVTGNDLDKVNRTYWHDDQDFRWNVSNGALPPQRMLYIVRITMALFGVASCVLMYFLGKALSGIKTGIIACFLLAFNPLMLRWCQKAVAESLLLFFSILDILFIALFVHILFKNKKRFFLPLIAVMGLNFTLCIGIKLSGIIGWLVFLIVCFLLLVLRRPFEKSARWIIFGFLSSTFIAVSILTAITPTLYDHPIAESLKSAGFINSYFDQRLNAGQPLFKDHFFGSAGEKITAVFKRTLLPSPTVYASGNISKIYDQVLPYGFVSLGAILKLSRFPIDLIFFLLGLSLIFYREAANFLLLRRLSTAGIILIWLYVTYIATGIMIPLDWERYYLPLIPCVVIIVAFGLSVTLDICGEKIRGLMKIRKFLPAKIQRNWES